jgi:hypothetical protein
MGHFTPVDTMNANSFLREVVQPDGSAVLHFLMPVTGFDYQGHPVTPRGFGEDYGLYLTIDATHPAGQVGGIFSSLNVTLWADPFNDAGAASVSRTNDPSFSNGTAHDIILATGTMVSASVSLDATGTRSADDVVSMTPTLAGTLLLDGSIKPGSLLEIKTTTPSGDFFTYTDQPGETTVDLVQDGAATVTLDPQGTILLPNLPPDILDLSGGPSFIHGSHHDGHGHHDQRA